MESDIGTSDKEFLACITGIIGSSEPFELLTVSLVSHSNLALRAVQKKARSSE